MRPRDVILFFNLCIAQAKDNPRITAQMVREAEGEYSRLRLRSLADEWQSDFPVLLSFVDLLKEKRPHFAVEEITDDNCLQVCMQLHEHGSAREDELSLAASSLVEGTIDYDQFRRTVLVAFYKIGLVGLKLEQYQAVAWSIGSRRSVSVSEVRPGTRVAIHSCFWRTLGVQDVASPRQPVEVAS
jgi:hypothetical protein